MKTLVRLVMSYSKEFKVIIATIYGEAGASSRRSWEVIAHSIRNRIGFGNWTQYTTMYGIVTNTGYDAYTHKSKPYLKAMSRLDANNFTSDITGKIVKDIIDTVKPIYEGKIEDDTNGVVFYWSPRTQKQLHKDNPRLYTSPIPSWTNDNKKKIVQIPGTEEDDFQWLKFIRSKMFITLYGSNGLPLVGKKVDIRFADGKKVPLLSNLETNSKGQLPAFYARIEMGVRLLIDGEYLKDNKGKRIRILPTGKDVIASIIVDTSEGFKSSLEIHKTDINGQNNNNVNITNRNSSNNPSNNTSNKNLPSEVNFNIKLVEADTGKPLPNQVYYLNYKNNIKPHKTDSTGIETNIRADVNQPIGVLLNDDEGKKQSISSMDFDVTADLNGQTKVLKVPVVSFSIRFVDDKNKVIPNYAFKTIYRNRESEIRKANSQGITQLKALAGQKITIVDGNGRAKTSGIVTDGALKWTIRINSSVLEESKTSSKTPDVVKDEDSLADEKSSTNNNTPELQVKKPKIKEKEVITSQGPTHVIESENKQVTIKFIDEETEKPLSGIAYATETKKFGKNNWTTGRDGTKGRPHNSEVGIVITVYTYENGKEVKKGIITTSANRDEPYVYKTKKPKLEVSGAHWHSRFRASTSLDDLSEPFKSNAKKFISAMKAAQITVSISTTFRPDARSYLMYYSTKITRGQIKPEDVPPWPGVNIDWTHNGNRNKALKAAKAMHASYGIGGNPVGRPSNSNHNVGLAIDMKITNYTGKVISLNGKRYKINNFSDLVAIGRKVSVIWFGNGDKPHWSHNGR